MFSDDGTAEGGTAEAAAVFSLESTGGLGSGDMGFRTSLVGLEGTWRGRDNKNC